MTAVTPPHKTIQTIQQIHVALQQPMTMMTTTMELAWG